MSGKMFIFLVFTFFILVQCASEPNVKPEKVKSQEDQLKTFEGEGIAFNYLPIYKIKKKYKKKFTQIELLSKKDVIIVQIISTKINKAGKKAFIRGFKTSVTKRGGRFINSKQRNIMISFMDRSKNKKVQVIATQFAFILEVPVQTKKSQGKVIMKMSGVLFTYHNKSYSVWYTYPKGMANKNHFKVVTKSFAIL